MLLHRPQRAWERVQIARSIGEPYQKRWYGPSRSNRTTYDATAESNVNNKLSMLADCLIINYEKHIVVMAVPGHAVRPVCAEAESLM